MKRLLAVLAAACVAGVALLAIPALAATKTVRLKDSYFAPKSLTIRKNTKVRFVWSTKKVHNVHAIKGPEKFRSGAPTKRGDWPHTFGRKGTYRIICDIHPGMTMTVKVN